MQNQTRQSSRTPGIDKKEEMVSYIVERLAEMPVEYVAYVYGLVQGLCED